MLPSPFWLREQVQRNCSNYVLAIRNQEALAEGFNEVLQEKIARYESSDLEPKQKAALRLCDAIILTPSMVDAALKDELKAYFSKEQIAELMLDVMKLEPTKGTGGFAFGSTSMGRNH